MKASDYDSTLDELYVASVGRLMAVEVFGLNAFEKLKSYLAEKSELIKKEHVISKQVAYCLLMAAQVIESRAEHVPGVLSWAIGGTPRQQIRRIGSSLICLGHPIM